MSPRIKLLAEITVKMTFVLKAEVGGIRNL
jgi:hypothetical protein